MTVWSRMWSDVKGVTGGHWVSSHSPDYACKAVEETHMPHRESDEMRQTQTTSSDRKTPLASSDVMRGPLSANKQSCEW